MTKLLLDILRIFMDLLVFRAGPQDLPKSHFLLKITTIFYYLAGVFIALLDFPFSDAGLISFLDTVLLMGMISLALWVRDLTNRIPQTLSATLGSLGLLTCFSFPVIAWYATFIPIVESENNFFPSFVILIWLAWSLAILTHILRNALDINQFIAATFSIIYLISSFSLTVILFFP